MAQEEININKNKKILIMCEGTTEKAIIDILLDNNKLRFKREDLIGSNPYHIRNLKLPYIKSEIKHYAKPITIIRIGDKQNDKLVIPKELKNYISVNDIYKVCTKPELEILLIINENLINDFNKSKKPADIYAIENIRIKKWHYDKTPEFLFTYYKNIKKLIKNIEEYKRIKLNLKNEFYLADLLNK